MKLAVGFVLAVAATVSAFVPQAPTGVQGGASFVGLEMANGEKRKAAAKVRLQS